MSRWTGQCFVLVKQAQYQFADPKEVEAAWMGWIWAWNEVWGASQSLLTSDYSPPPPPPAPATIKHKYNASLLQEATTDALQHRASGKIQEEATNSLWNAKVDENISARGLRGQLIEWQTHIPCFAIIHTGHVVNHCVVVMIIANFSHETNGVVLETQHDCVQFHFSSCSVYSLMRDRWLKKNHSRSSSSKMRYRISKLL